MTRLLQPVQVANTDKILRAKPEGVYLLVRRWPNLALNSDAPESGAPVSLNVRPNGGHTIPMNDRNRPSRHTITRAHGPNVCYLGFAAALISACSTEGVEITAYPMLCDKPVVNGTCRGNAIPLNRETYRVFPASQQVVSWTPGISDTPIRLEQCAVRDSGNWKCHLPHYQGEVGFANGEFKETLTPPRLAQEKFFCVGGVKWWWHQLVASRF